LRKRSTRGHGNGLGAWRELGKTENGPRNRFGVWMGGVLPQTGRKRGGEMTE